MVVLWGVHVCVCCDVLALHLVQVVLSPQSPLETPGDGESSSYALLHTSEHSIKLVQLLINLSYIITVVLLANISISTHNPCCSCFMNLQIMFS